MVRVPVVAELPAEAFLDAPVEVPVGLPVGVTVGVAVGSAVGSAAGFHTWWCGTACSMEVYFQNTAIRRSHA